MFCAGSALDIATTWTEAPAGDVAGFPAAVRAGRASANGEHGSSVKLAHAVGALLVNAYVFVVQPGDVWQGCGKDRCPKWDASTLSKDIVIGGDGNPSGGQNRWKPRFRRADCAAGEP